MYFCILGKIKAIIVEELFVVEFSQKEKEIVKTQVEPLSYYLAKRRVPLSMFVNIGFWGRRSDVS